MMLNFTRPTHFSVRTLPPRINRRLQVRAAADDEDAAFEERLKSLRTAKGMTPYGEGKKSSDKKATPVVTKKGYDFSDETVFYEGPPHRGDLAVNMALVMTIVWLPLTAAAVGRAAFINYRVTDKRVQVITTAPWKQETLDVPYQEVKDVVVVPRGIGAWGDMVISLRNGEKAELRSLDKFRELKEYILKQRDAMAAASAASSRSNASGSGPSSSKGGSSGFA